MAIRNAIGEKLCQIFQQPTDRVQSVTITIEADMATAEISRFVEDDELQQICALFEYFKLIKTGEYKQVHPQGFGFDDNKAWADDEWGQRVRQALEQEGR